MGGAASSLMTMTVSHGHVTRAYQEVDNGVSAFTKQYRSLCLVAFQAASRGALFKLQPFKCPPWDGMAPVMTRTRAYSARTWDFLPPCILGLPGHWKNLCEQKMSRGSTGIYSVVVTQGIY